MAEHRSVAVVFLCLVSVMHPGFLPGIHPFAFPFAGKFGGGSAMRAKPLSRPFTLADAIPGGAEFPYGGGNFGGIIVDSGDGFFGGDVNGIIGGGLGGSFIGGNDIVSRVTTRLYPPSVPYSGRLTDFVSLFSLIVILASC